MGGTDRFKKMTKNFPNLFFRKAHFLPKTDSFQKVWFFPQTYPVPLLLISLLFSFSLGLGCSSQKRLQLFEFGGKTMGTTYSVKFTASHGFSLKALKKEVAATLNEVNRQMSTYREDSEISRVNKALKGERVPISDWFGEVLSLSLQMAKESQGAFDPTIGPLVNLWGFGPQKRKSPPSLKKIRAVQKWVGFEKLKLLKDKKKGWSVIKAHSQVFIDLSASAKGFGVDRLSKKLHEKGLTNHLVEIGGELRANGHKFSKPWQVAIEKPLSTHRSIQEVVELKGASLATSGSYRNFFRSQGKLYPHTISGDTGRPAMNRLLSVSVIEKDCVRADALATALMVMGPDRAMAFAREKNLAVFLIMAPAIKEKKGREGPKEAKQKETQTQHWSTKAFDKYLKNGDHESP